MNHLLFFFSPFRPTLPLHFFDSFFSSFFYFRSIFPTAILQCREVGKIKSIKSSFWTSKQFNINLLSCHFHGWLLWGQQRKVLCTFAFHLYFDGVFVSSPEWVDVQSIWTTVKHWLLKLDCFFFFFFIFNQLHSSTHSAQRLSNSLFSVKLKKEEKKKSRLNLQYSRVASPGFFLVNAHATLFPSHTSFITLRN